MITRAVYTKGAISVNYGTLALAAALIAGVGLRLAHLNAALWYDEAFSAWLAGLPLNRLVAATQGDVHPPFYYFVLWTVSRVLGHAEAVLRLPSLLAGLALLPVVYGLAQRLRLSRQAAVLATVITALAPFQIYYSGEARSYALLTLAVAGAGWSLLARRWTLAIFSSLAALYLHNMAPLFVGSIWLGAALYHYRGTRANIWRTATVVAVGYLPGLIWTALQAGNVSQDYWIVPIQSPGRLVATLDDLLFFATNNPFVFATAFVTSVTIIFLVLPGTWRSSGPNTKFLAIAAFLPLASVTIVSLVWQPVLITRVMAPIAPFYYLLIAWSVTLSRRRLLAWSALAGPVAACVLLAALLPSSVGRSAPHGDYQQFYGLEQPGDALYHANTGSYVVWHYYRPDIRQVVWPQETTLNGGLTAQTRGAMGMVEADFEAVACTADRWWLLYAHNPVTDPAEIEYIDHLINHYPSTKIKTLRSDITTDAGLVLIEPDCPR